MANFEMAVERVLEHEGGYVFNPNDPGGETNFGISKKSYPNTDIKNLKRIDAIEIYRRDYWKKVCGNDILDQLSAEVLFDAAVNIGVRRASKLAQACVLAKQDGIIGRRTLHKLNLTNAFPVHFTLARVKYYTELVSHKRSLGVFLLGWIKRTVSYN